MKRKKHSPTRQIIMILVLLSAAACQQKAPETKPCSDPVGCVHIGPSDPVLIGALQAQSGSAAINGEVQINSIRLALQQQGQSLLGHSIRLQVEDSGCSQEGGTSSALKIALNLNTVAVIGTLCSESAKTAAKVLSDAGIVMISGANSAPSLTSVNGKKGANWHPGYFRIMHNGSRMAEAAAVFARKELGLTRFSVIDDGEIYSMEFASTFAGTIRRLGGEIVSTPTISKGDQDLNPVITALRPSKTECIFFPIYQQDAERLIHHIRAEPETKDIVLIGGGALLTEPFLENCGTDCIGVFFASVVYPRGPATERLIREYEKKYNRKPAHFSFAHAVDATNMLLSAIRSVAVVHPDNSLTIGRQALRNALYQTRNFKGLTGSLSCDRFGDCSDEQYHVLRLDRPEEGLRGLRSNVIYTHPRNPIDTSST